MSRTRFERNQCPSRGCGLHTLGTLTFMGGQFDRNQCTGSICYGAGAYAAARSQGSAGSSIGMNVRAPVLEPG